MDSVIMFFHNLLGHPLMGILHLFGFRKAGDWIHEATLPKSAKQKISLTKYLDRKIEEQKDAEEVEPEEQELNGFIIG